MNQEDELHFKVLDHPTGLIVKISGDAGVTNVTRLEREFAKIAALHPPLVVLDLSSLDFIASLGLGVLLAFRQSIVRSGGTLRVAAATPKVLDSLKRAALNALFSSCESVEQALTLGPG